MRTIWKVLIGSFIFFILFTVFRPSINRAYYNFVEYWNLRDKIVWSKNDKLEWSDFKYDPNSDGIVAVTAMSKRWNFNDPFFRSITVFSPLESTVEDTTDLYYLRSAQAKFDLLEIYRRDMMAEFDTLNKAQIKRLKSDYFKKIGDRYYHQYEFEWQAHLNSTNIEQSLELLEERIQKDLFKE